MKTFDELGLDTALLESIREIGFETPSPIQEEVIPYLLESSGDVIALAQTGTGKTAAFGLPILQKTDLQLHEIQALVLSPTRELCVQIATELKRYSTRMEHLHLVAVYGGEDIRKQLKALDRTPQIVVATPGRLMDLVRRGKISLDRVRHLVLDEADEMLNMGFLDDITEILELLPAERRTLLFSATMPQEIARIAKTYMRDIREITVGVRGEAAKNVEHLYVLTPREERFEVLKRLLDYTPDIYGIVFCRTRQETKDVADALMQAGYNADALHGDLTQAQRDTVMNKFRIRHLQILVATDVAARGLDVNNLTHVIHYQLPDDSETYTHRSGRTGRVGKSGISIALITTRQRNAIAKIEKNIHREFRQMPIPTGEDICRRQMLHWAARLQNEPEAAQIDAWMGPVLDMLADVSKEDLLRRLMQLECGRFADYYREADDLNQLFKKTKDRSKSAKTPKDADYPALKKGKRRGDESNPNFVRLKIDRGRNDKFEPRRLLGLINDVTGDRSIVVGEIDIAPKFSFFSVPKHQVAKIYEAFAVSPKAKGIRLGDVKGERRTKNNDEIAPKRVSHRYESRGATRKK